MSSIKQKCLSVLRVLDDLDGLQKITDFSQEIQFFKNRLEDNEFRIAVVGEYSSGKSTFINALLGQDILSHATTETTAAITRIVNTEESDPRSHTGIVTFQDGKTLKLENLQGLREYTTKSSSRFNVINDIKTVEIFMPILPVKHQVVFIDTPGLNGLAEGHRERTVELVQQAHACIYLLQLRGLSDSDVNFIRYLSHYQKNFIFVQNFIDELSRIEGDDLADKLSEQKKILENDVFSSDDHVRYSICGISALMALTFADNSIQRLYDSSPLLTDETRKQLYEASHFAEFRTILSETFKDQNLEKLQFGDTALALEQWLGSLLERVKRRENLALEVYHSSKEGRHAEQMIRLREKVLTSKSQQEEYLGNFIITSCEGIRREETESLRQTLTQSYEVIADEINDQKRVEDLENWSESLGEYLQSKLEGRLYDWREKYICKIQVLYERIRERVEEYSGIKAETVSFEDIDIHIPERKIEKFQQQEDQIKKLRNQITAESKKIEEYDRDQLKAQAEAESQEREAERLLGQKQWAEREKAAQVQRLGTRPRAEERTEYYTDLVYRGGWGILDRLFGPKEVRRPKIVRDDSAGQAWDREKAKIQNTFIGTIANLERQRNAALRAAERAKGDTTAAVQRREMARNRVNELEEKIQWEKKVLEENKKKAAAEFLAFYKRDLCKQVQDYLICGDNSVLNQMIEGIKEELLHVRKDFIPWAIQLFEQALNQKLAWIEQVRLQNSPTIFQETQEWSNLRSRVENLRQELEEIL